MANPFHSGERAVQDRAGMRERRAEIGPRANRDAMPEQHRAFFAELPFVLIGSVDAAGATWASLLTGAPGFGRAPDPRTLAIAARPALGDPLAESLGFASWAATFFLDLPGTEAWRCFCAVDGDEPLAYAVMHFHEGVAVLAIASRLAKVRDGLGQAAVLHRCISEAVRAGCTTMAVAEAGTEPAVGDRRSLLRAGFKGAARSFTWLPRARVPM
jgi:hypothetical protein